MCILYLYILFTHISFLRVCTNYSLNCYFSVDAAEGVEKKRKDQKEKKEGDNDEFDMFAQSRNATYEKTKNRYYILCLNNFFIFHASTICSES